MFVFPRQSKKFTAVWSRALHVGLSASDVRIFCASDVESFLQLTGDQNPIHVERSAAQQAGFRAPVLPGILVATLFPAIIGSRFPGTVYASQTLRFRAPALVGQAVVAKVTVQRVSGRRVTFSTTAMLQDTGKIIVDGEALAIIPDSASA